MNDRLILAIRKSELPSAVAAPGFHAIDEPLIAAIFQQAGLWLGPRKVLESDEMFRQIIPYIVLRNGRRLLVYRRSTAGAEKRLHGLLSIGLGGHIDLSDIVVSSGELDLWPTLRAAADRELREELGKVSVQSHTWIGVLTEDATSVGRVHLGVVGVCVIDDDVVEPADEAVCDVRWAEVGTLEYASDAMESWSAMLLSHFETA